MSDEPTAEVEDRVLVLAPTARDGAASRDILAAAGVRCLVCHTLAAVCREAGRGAGAAVVTAEAVLGDREGILAGLLRTQPPWSDLPLVVLTPPGAEPPQLLRALEAVGPMTLMKRPVQVSALVSTVRSALRDRRRQYAVRDYLAEHRRQAEALAAAEGRLRLMVENVRDYAIFSLDTAGRVASWNSGAEHVFGWAEAEILGRDGAVLFTPEDRAAGVPARELATAREVGRAEDERWHLRKDGSRFFASGVMTPIRDGRLHGYAKVCRDNTTRKQAEEAVRAADRQKDEFMAMLAHELRNPLTPLRNALQILALRDGDPGAVAQVRGMMERQVGHLGRLVDDLLDVSRITTGKVQLRKERLDLAHLARQAAADHRTAFEAKRVSLGVSTPDSPVWVSGDPTRLAQVLDNLLTNALKFTPRNGQVSVSVESDPGGRAVLTVRDTGAGIAPEMLGRLFEPFSQADRTLDRSPGGLGLGLAIVKGLAELHGGSARAESGGFGEGAAFTVTLPAYAAPPALSARPEPPRPAGKRLRVLVVEDNPDAADSLRLLLEAYGHQVAVANSGPDGVRAAAEHRPDVVVCDIGLPGMDGYRVAEALRENPATAAARLIALTGYGRDEDRRRAREAGFDEHLTKPADPAALESRLAATAD